MIACAVRGGHSSFGSRDRQRSPLGRQAARICTCTRRRWNGCAAVKQSFKSFDDMLLNSTRPILVDFYATWCGPCVMMADVLEEVAPQVKEHMSVVKINTEKYTHLAARYGIQELPTLIVFKNGEVEQRITAHASEHSIRWAKSMHAKKPPPPKLLPKSAINALCICGACLMMKQPRTRVSRTQRN